MFVNAGDRSLIRNAMFRGPEANGSTLATVDAIPMLQAFALTRQAIWLFVDSLRQPWPIGSVGLLPFRFVERVKCRRKYAVTVRFWRGSGMLVPEPDTGMFGLT